MVDLVLISEDFEGHRQSYIKDVISRCQEIGHNLHIVTSCTNFCIELDSFNHVRTYKIPGNRRDIFCKAQELVRELPSSILIVWELERWYKYIFKYRNSCRAIAMRPYLSFTSPKNFFATLFKIFLNFCLSSRSNFQVRRLSIPNQFHVFPFNWVDELPQFSVNLDKHLQNRDVNELKLGVLGSISSRKQPEACIAFAESVSKNYDLKVYLNFVGKIHSDIDLSNLKSNNIEITIVNRYIDYEDYLSHMSECDYILCFYENLGSARTPLETIAVGAKCLFLDSSKRWKGLERKYPNYFFRFKKIDELEKKFAYSLSFKNSQAPVDWMPNLSTWLDFLIGEKSIKAEE